MMLKVSCAAVVLSLLVGCGGSGEASPPLAPVAPAPTPTATPAPTSEDLSGQVAALQAERDREKLQRDYEELTRSHEEEQKRLTKPLRAEALALTQSSKPSTFAALPKILQSAHRRPGSAQRDAQRHPRETLEFFGIEPYHAVLEYGPGGGWYTELLAPLLHADGQLYVTTADPAGPADSRATLYAKRTQLFLEGLPEVYSKVQPLLFDSNSPRLALKDEQLDVVLIVRGLHGILNNGNLDATLKEFNRVLKVGGTLAVVQHRAAPDAPVSEASKKGYLPEPYVIEQVSKAGFRLVSSSDINANPNDTKDHPHGVWSLPPSLAGGEQDKYKYVSIGESDRMTLRFVKAP